MALNEFPVVPLTGASDETVRVNKHTIIDVRVINVGRTQAQNENWYIQVNMLAGKYYMLQDGSAPYASRQDAIDARDAFLDTFS
jgi:hypothetical protein